MRFGMSAVVLGLALSNCDVAVVMAQEEPPPSAAIPSPAGTLVGPWTGAISLPGMDLRIELEFTGDAGELQGSIAIPAQGARGLVLEGISLDGDQVRFRIAGIPGEPSFEGTLDGDAVRGTFKQAGAEFPFQLERGGRGATESRRPQDPVRPLPYVEQEVEATNGEVVLSGTLTRPEGDGPFPAVVLISGSGPQNRDEELFDHRPFAVLADHLTRGGILVVRYDDRGVGKSTGQFAGATSTMLSGDAEAWVGVLRGREDVAGVGLIGHSEGAMLAAMVAARNPTVDFIVMLAGTGVDGVATLVEQNRAIMLAAGAGAERAARVADLARELFDAIAGGESDDELGRRIRALAEAQGAGGGGGGVDDKVMEQMVAQQLRSIRSPWFDEFLHHNPAGDLQRVKAPVLAMNGTKDVQVVAAQHLPAIEAALKKGGNTRFRIERMEGLNHLFQECRPPMTGGVAEYGRIEETMNPAALDLVRDWVLRWGSGEPGSGGGTREPEDGDQTGR